MQRFGALFLNNSESDLSAFGVGELSLLDQAAEKFQRSGKLSLLAIGLLVRPQNFLQFSFIRVPDIGSQRILITHWQSECILDWRLATHWR